MYSVRIRNKEESHTVIEFLKHKTPRCGHAPFRVRPLDGVKAKRGVWCRLGDSLRHARYH
jgi:hypothetical protein